MSEGQESIRRVSRLLDELTDCGSEINKRVNRIWMSLVVSMVVGAFVIGGLVVHAIGDYFRFDSVNEQLTDLKRAVTQCNVGKD